MFAWLTPRFAALDAYPLTKEIPMVQTDFRTALRSTNETEITVSVDEKKGERSLCVQPFFVALSMSASNR